ncbi:hypothetical protein L207DRAFT_512616 [Hyaloscypha variabilis F]|uniref:Transposase Tc1-like domain-containing protein n=1 Tax=Hyaloscypha variabilis (strain UAMH 11265 / GT02V1 / F) TaxID=1149755 RepID=A0A2J6RM53_HYAVF|nr:hypothetical protein L207DRAFT_512616 [Hyaloscypha variabilis F]
MSNGLIFNWSTRRLTFEQVRTQLGIEASARTIRRELRRAGYRRCIACPRPYISHRRSDEATFKIGKYRRIWVTRRVDEKRCISYMRSVYWSGRVSVMI